MPSLKILVINTGSSSLKMQLLEKNSSGKHAQKENFVCHYNGMIDGINTKKSLGKEKYGTGKLKENKFTVQNPTHAEAIQILLTRMRDAKIIQNPKNEITAIGHRVVHGGEKYQKATRITPNVTQEIKKLCHLAPLHNPPNLAGIEACKNLFPKMPQIAVFDTAFHMSLKQKAFLYAIPYTYYKKFAIRRYGFHGISHRYVAAETIKLLKKSQSKIITCHLGNGSSITAILNGKSIDTSMGLTPLEGIPMGTRSGDIDPAIIFHLGKKLKIKTDAMEEILLRKSGLQGISEISWDMRELHDLDKKKDPRARRALEILAYRIAKYIGAYTAALNGLDALTFTGGIGENADYVRAEICEYLTYLGLTLDPKKNRKNALEISTKKSTIKVYVIPTNEELEIATETEKVLKAKK